MHQSYQAKRRRGLLSQLRTRLSQSHQQIADTSAVFTADTGALLLAPVPDTAPQITTGAAFAPNGWLSLVPWLIPRRSTVVIEPPAGRAPSQALLLLHGCDQDADSFARNTGAYQLATDHGWVVVLVSQSPLANPHKCWNWFDANTQHGGGEVAIAMSALDSVTAQWHIKPAQTYLAGMSSGAALAAAICANHPNRFAAAMFHSGVSFRASESALTAKSVLENGVRRDRDVTKLVKHSSDTAALIIHGADDPTVNPEHAHELMRQTLTLSGHIDAGGGLPAGCSTRRQLAANRYMTTTNYGPHRYIRIDGLGHAWSGGSANGASYFDDTGPDAFELMRIFFDDVSRRIRPGTSPQLQKVAVLSS
ncbi:MAG: PHB depolymerase family esterase [Burkholderiaceae bacterium]